MQQDHPSTKARHTPGPWEASGTHIHAHTHGGALTKRIARADGGEFGADDEAHANARLIAAAPELLAALKAVLFAQQHLLGQFELEDLDAVERARAAITKAEG